MPRWEIVNDNIASGFVTFVSGKVLGANLMGYGTNENNSPAVISVERLGGSSGQIAVDFATTNGTAFLGTNYLQHNQSFDLDQRRLLGEDGFNTGA